MVGRPLVVPPKGLMSYKNHYWYIIKGSKEGSQLAIQSAGRNEDAERGYRQGWSQIRSVEVLVARVQLIVSGVCSQRDFSIRRR